ncbi:MAG: hypothetical protein IV100_34945 [Myxococcales bacterium]|nr:hypothetical protein [Myxococcales bacterium]
MGLVSEFVPVWARSEGASQATVGALGSLVGLWSFKVLFGPLVDGFSTLKRWTVLALFALSGLLVFGALAPSAVIPALVVVALLGGLQDVALDGWIVGATPPSLRARVAGVRVAAYRSAMALGGGGAIALGGRLGWEAGWWLVAGGLLLVGVIITTLDEPVPAERVTAKRFFGDLLAWCLEPRTLAILVFCILFKLGDAAAATMTRSFWVDAGLDTDQIGLLGALGGSALTALGAVLGGEIASRMGLPRALLALGTLQLLSNGLYAIVAAAPSTWAVMGAGAIEALTAGLGSAPLVALLMGSVGSVQPATRFAAISAAVGISRALASLVSGYGASELGYAGWFALTMAIGLPGVLLSLSPWPFRGLEARDGP